MLPAVRILEPSNIDVLGLLPQRVQELRQLGFEVHWDPLEKDKTLPFLAGSRKERSQRLWQALTEDETDIVLCARGGYGASDLLDDIPWSELKNYPSKTFIGFSDVCAIMTPLVYLAGWPIVHGPMPSSKLWQPETQENVRCVIDLIGKKGLDNHPVKEISLSLTALHKGFSKELTGQIFGGNMSVLTNLLGTPFLPKFQQETILFFEDVAENPGKLIRMANHWKQTGQLNNVSGIILGDFGQLERVSSVAVELQQIKQELAHRLAPVPCWSTEQVGHCLNNWPIPLGKEGKIRENSFVFSI